MKEFDLNQVYYEIEITANSPITEIWLGDDKGHFVQKEVGTLQSSLMPGHFIVEFGLGSTCYPISLRDNTQYIQDELEAGPSCPRPKPKLNGEN